jgi:hypothetical protein
MRSWLLAASVALLALVPVAVALANPAVWPKAVPDPRPKASALPLTVRADPLTRTTTLSLPAATVRAMRAELPPEGGDGAGRPGVLPAHTIVAGVALSVALVLGGLWLVRGARRRALAGFVCLLAAVAVVGVSCLPRHDDPPTPTPPELAPPTLKPDGTLAGRCRLSTDPSDEVVLSINRDALTELARQATKAETGRGAP